MSRSPVYIGAGSAELSVEAALDLISTSATASDELAVFQSLFHGSSGTAPSGGTVSDGDLWFDTSVGVDAMKVYSSTASAWELISPTASEQTNINSVAADSSDIGRVAAVDTEIGRLGISDMSVGTDAYLKKLGVDAFSNASTGYIKKVSAIDTNITKVANIDGDVTKVADIDGNVTKVADIDGNVTKVADIDDKVTTVAGIDDKVTTVAGDTTNINIVGDDLSDQFSHIDDLGLIADDVTGGSGTSNITTVAGNLTNINNFADLYQIDDFSPDPPTTDGGGVDAVAAGDLAYDSTANVLKFYNGSTFVTIAEGDLTSIVAGTGLSGTSLSGPIPTINHTAHTGDVTGATALTITNDAVTYAKMQNVSATNKILGRDSASAGVIEEISPANVVAMLGIEASADVTDVTNVTAAGALMDSELTTIALVKGLASGISDGNVLTANDAVADNDYLMIDGTEVEGRTFTQVRSDLGIEAGATADQTQADINGLAITTVGTIGTGTWQGTTIAVNQGGTGVTASSTGSGGVVLSTSPTLVTPDLGTPSSMMLDFGSI